ncbi:MAG: hypothetical protein CJD30_09240 [Sulfuricurvum sp. PD_MW2]|jgi:serine/threonine protein kinase|uniref:protein kinase domain-containing protein n=1 Tax=Sulfuricurvum sp. PD_MW2 TaxID=2027917 RepID=UPI000C0631D7|nr:protein kinase [Sulfuricurvum sp. PD_MW2]PHM16938.1 MAG: hypothetical protein CJD30_09240 [Sulfuricurvum sp. PD_MW2]
MFLPDYLPSFQLAQGTHVGSYRIIRQLGRGWEGEVYEALTLQGSKVAIKILYRQNNDHIFIKSISEKLRQLKRINGIVQIQESGYDQSLNAHYLITSYIEGETIRAMMKRHVSYKCFYTIIEKYLAIIFECHQQNVSIGDLSVSNCIVDSNGDVTIIDMKFPETFHRESSIEEDIIETSRFIRYLLQKTGAPKKIICAFPLRSDAIMRRFDSIVSIQEKFQKTCIDQSL